MLKGISLAIPERDITVVIGGSGSGKSVLIKHMIGLIRPDRGQVRVFDQDLGTIGPRGVRAVQARIGMLFQGAALFDSMSVEENIAFPLVEGRRQPKCAVMERVQEVAERLSVADLLSRMPADISNGQRKRVGPHR